MESKAPPQSFRSKGKDTMAVSPKLHRSLAKSSFRMQSKVKEHLSIILLLKSSNSLRRKLYYISLLTSSQLIPLALDGTISTIVLFVFYLV